MGRVLSMRQTPNLRDPFSACPLINPNNLSMGVEKEGRLSEDDPNVLLHNTLRGQIDDLLQQVSQLNGKVSTSPPNQRVSTSHDTFRS